MSNDDEDLYNRWLRSKFLPVVPGSPVITEEWFNSKNLSFATRADQAA
jgi:hypothetical protein